MSENKQKISEIIENFKKLIPKSKDLARDAENLCNELGKTGFEKMDETIEKMDVTIGSLMADIKELNQEVRGLEKELKENTNLEVFQEVVEEIIFREPDATLREKLRELVCELRFGIDKHKILIALNLPPFKS